jgi:multiple sugar transport system permease protein
MYVLLIVLALIYISPFLIQVLNSFKTDAAATAYRVSSIRAISTR